MQKGYKMLLSLYVCKSLYDLMISIHKVLQHFSPINGIHKWKLRSQLVLGYLKM